MSARLILIGGGVRCGKSAFALTRARQLGSRRAFVATAEVRDEEMRKRVRLHVEERGREFRTVEAPRELTAALSRLEAEDVVVIDCLTLWLSNLLLDGLSDASIAARVQELVEALSARRFHSIVVTNEVGLGIVPDNALARRFRDVAGRAHQMVARATDEMYFAALGQMLRLRPGPVELAELSAAEAT